MCAKHNTTRQTSKHRQPPLGAPPTRQVRSKGRKDRWEARSGASCKATTTNRDQGDPGVIQITLDNQAAEAEAQSESFSALCQH